jgi:hypothetical protein
MHERGTFEWIEDDEIGRNRRSDGAIDKGLKAAVSKLVRRNTAPPGRMAP